MKPVCCEMPLFRIEDFDYGSVIKSAHFHFAQVQNLMATLPYPHRHNFFHIVWIERGTGQHIIDEVKYTVRPGALFFMRPGQVHDFDLSDDTEGYTISFSSEFFALQLQDKNMLTQIPVYDDEHPVQAVYTEGRAAQEIRRTLERIRDEYDEEGYRSQDVIRSYLFILLVRASRTAVPTVGMEVGSRAQLLYRRFKALLDEKFATTQEPEDYAQLLRCTERALNAAARRCAGATTSQLIRDRVILEAKRLLAHSGAQVAQVATQLGFDDPAYFSRCFKKHTGRTPVEFRQSIVRMTE